jgi:hypothetical protein
MGLLFLAATLGGCVFGLPPRSAIPPDTPPEVREGIGKLYWDAQWRAQGCVDIHRLAASGTDCSAAVPWLVVLLTDDAYAWSPSIWIRYRGTPVHLEARSALLQIGEPAVPALKEAAATSSCQKRRRRAAEVLGEMRSREEGAAQPE